MWIGLTFSPGFKEKGSPFDFEQPFFWNSNRGRWRLDRPEPEFYRRVKDVIDYCSKKTPAIIVEVTLFAHGEEGSYTNSPWDSSRNFTGAKLDGVGFTSPSYVMSFDSGYNINDPDGEPDSDGDNEEMRRLQVAFLEKAVLELNPYTNFYWEIANEPDFNTVTLPTDIKAMIDWHNYMAKKIVAAEASLPNKHVIAANFITKDAFENVRRGQFDPTNFRPLDPSIKVLSGHYVDISPKDVLQQGTTPPRLGAITMIRAYNRTTTPIASRLFGFNETQISHDPNSRMSSRAEAWEFMLSEGGLYDNLNYAWNRPPPTGGTCDATCRATCCKYCNDSSLVRTDLGNLNQFLKYLYSYLPSMRRDTGSKPTWVTNGVGDYGSFDSTVGANTYWGAMKSTDNRYYALYIHHSTISPAEGAKWYIPKTGNYRRNFTFNLSGAPIDQHFKVEWFVPPPCVLPAVSQTITVQPLQWKGTAVTLQSPAYTYDLAVRITPCPGSAPCELTKENQPPSASFNFTCTNLVCFLDAYDSTDDQGIDSYSWSFGDSTFDSGVTTSHTFPNTGAHTVTLTVTDTHGVQSSTSKKVSVTDEIPVAAEGFFTVPPCRIADTHTTTPLTTGVQRTFQVTGLCGIPASAKAVSFNATVVSPTGGGHLVFFPGNQTSGPFAHATHNFDPANSPRANNGIVRLATNGVGSINVAPFVSGSPGQVHLILDVYGYFSEDSAPAPGAQGPFGFQTVAPCRIADTRTGTPIAVNTSRSFTIQGVCGVPFGAAAAPLNLTIMLPTAFGHASLYPTGAFPPVPMINFNAGVMLTNGARIRLAPSTPDVEVNYYSPTGGASTHALIDVYGYFKTDAPLKYRPITPCRALDTRFAEEGGPALATGETRNFQIRGNCNVPLSAKAAMINITTVGSAGPGHLRVFASGGALPPASYLNFNPSQGALGNGGIVGLSTLANDLSIMASTGTDVIVDVFGYFQ